MANDEWRTPEWVWKPYGPFDLDAAATKENALAPNYITKEANALEIEWKAFMPRPCKIWCNPPYSKEAGPLDRWVEKFIYEWVHGFHITALLPADTSTNWFHKLWDLRSPRVRPTFLKKRVRHLHPETGKPGGSPKFGSLIVELLP